MYTSKECFAFADSPSLFISSIPPNPILLYAYNEEEKNRRVRLPERIKKKIKIQNQSGIK